MSVAYERDVEWIDGRSLSVLIEARNGTEWRLVCIVDGMLVWEREVTKRAVTKRDALKPWPDARPSILCMRCEGEGRLLCPDDSRVTCPSCDGYGRVSADAQ